MSKSKKSEKLTINTRDMMLHLAHGYSVNQKSAVMKDRTKFSRKPKHRRDFREERDAPVFIYM